MNPLRDRSAIVGVGYSKLSKNSGVSTLALAAEAIKNAVADAGLKMSDVDGLSTHQLNDSTGPNLVAPALGLKDLKYYVDHRGGGTTSHTAVGQAAMACATGVADCVVCYRALNSRSEMRMGEAMVWSQNMETQYTVPYGLYSPPQQWALAARAHMVKYGTTSEHWGRIAVSQRRNAALNERAMMRTPITMDDYLNSRWVAEPFRLLDCCLETDGACAIVVTGSERARQLRQKPVYISAAGWGMGHTRLSNQFPDLTETGAKFLAPRLFKMAGLGPGDIDVAELYDCFTHSVLLLLEEYGFCPKGEGGPFVATGAIELGGELPVNTHGGHLSEGYLHGLNHVCEAVSQLRGQAGQRQVPNAEVALSAAEGGMLSGWTSAVILRN